MDLDDLFDEEPTTKPTTTAQRHKSAAVGRFGAAKKGNDLDDLGDSFNFDEILGGGPKANNNPPPRKDTFGGGGSSFNGINSTKNNKPAARLE